VAEPEPQPAAQAAESTGAAEPASQPAWQVADWVVASDDNRDLPFMIVDKVSAEVLVFAADGRLLGRSPALLGLARGDESEPGIGDRPLSTIRPDERTTQAGRFIASLRVRRPG
jgi:hypothetical protein